MRFIVKRYYYFILICLTAFAKSAVSQSGWNKFIDVPHLENINLDDLIYENDTIYIRGNIYIDSIQKWGLYFAAIDTTGQVLWYNQIADTATNSHIVDTSPSCDFYRSENGTFAAPFHFFETQKLGFLLLDSAGEPTHWNQFSYDGLHAYPQSVEKYENSYYIFGRIQRLSSYSDLFVLKTDLYGNLIWVKYFGLYLNEENFGDVINNLDGSFTISSTIYSQGYYNRPDKGWRRPWIFTIDTSAVVIDEWIGEENDIRTHGGGQLIKHSDGSLSIVSTEYQYDDYWNLTNNAVTVSHLDSDMNLIWKKYLSNFDYPYDHIWDAHYDPVNESFILAGRKLEINASSSAVEGWLLKMSMEGEILWNRTDTNLYNPIPVWHRLVGVDVSPSGSIYACGDMDGNSQLYGWIIKVTADGCIDTLCLTTSIPHDGSKPEIKVFPNPTSGFIHINLPNEFNDAVFLLYDLYGQLIKSSVLESDDLYLDVAPGVYYYLIKNELNEISNGKLVVLE